MRRPALFPGLVLLGLGAYFLLKQLDVFDFQNYLSWPVILIIVGLAFLISSFTGWDQSLALPGGIILAIGLHFWGINLFTQWPSHWSFYPGAVGVGFLIAYLRLRKTEYLIPATILLALPVIFYLLDGFLIWEWWPLALILVGIYLLFKRK